MDEHMDIQQENIIPLHYYVSVYNEKIISKCYLLLVSF